MWMITRPARNNTIIANTDTTPSHCDAAVPSHIGPLDADRVHRLGDALGTSTNVTFGLLVDLTSQTEANPHPKPNP